MVILNCKRNTCLGYVAEYIMGSDTLFPCFMEGVHSNKQTETPSCNPTKLVERTFVSTNNPDFSSASLNCAKSDHSQRKTFYELTLLNGETVSFIVGFEMTTHSLFRMKNFPVSLIIFLDPSGKSKRPKGFGGWSSLKHVHTS